VLGILGVGAETIAPAAKSGSSTTTNKPSGTSTNQSQSNPASKNCPNL
jgi:hypothetical protein